MTRALVPLLALAAAVVAGVATYLLFFRSAAIPARGTIVFASATRDPSCDDENEPCPLRLYSIDARGGGPKAIARLGVASAPTFSPSGDRIAYSAPCGKKRSCIAVADADGGNARVITRGRHDLDPRWSPDGRKILFVRMDYHDAYSTKLFAVSPSGGPARRVGPDRFVGEPSWSPDGRSIVVTRGAEVLVANTRASLAVLRRDGTHARRITLDGFHDGEPAWSPDARWIAFVRIDESTRTNGIYLVRPDGTDLHRLVRGDYREPAWSPDSRYLVASRFEDGDDDHPNGGRSLVILKPRWSLGDTGAREWRLTPVGDIDQMPVWRPR